MCDAFHNGVMQVFLLILSTYGCTYLNCMFQAEFEHAIHKNILHVQK